MAMPLMLLNVPHGYSVISNRFDLHLSNLVKSSCSHTGISVNCPCTFVRVLYSLIIDEIPDFFTKFGFFTQLND